MGLFGPKRPLSQDELDWQIAAFAWLVQEDGGLAPLKARLLANPVGAYFAESTASGHARAEELLAEVKALAGMDASWTTQLVEQGTARGAVLANGGGTIIPAPHGAAAGTFVMRGDDAAGYIAEITYDPEQLADPSRLVATLAHELAHYRLAYTSHSFPGGDALHEHLTDLTAVYFGFGIFLANSARDYDAQQTELGGHQWQYRQQGYLSERALITALVIGEQLAERDPQAARPWLKPYLRADLDIACRWFAKHDVAAAVRDCDLSDYGVQRRDLVAEEESPVDAPD
jgi:hypothetical protein